jgi:predicted Zn-dependent peptidase
LTKAKTQLRARLVFENDSITNIAHQLGYFATIARWQDFHALAGRIEAVSLEQVSQVASRRLDSMSRTIGWFSPTAQ